MLEQQPIGADRIERHLQVRGWHADDHLEYLFLTSMGKAGVKTARSPVLSSAKSRHVQC